MIQDVAQIKERTGWTGGWWHAAEFWCCLLCSYGIPEECYMKHHLEQEHALSPIFVGYSTMYIESAA